MVMLQYNIIYITCYLFDIWFKSTRVYASLSIIEIIVIFFNSDTDCNWVHLISERNTQANQSICLQTLQSTSWQSSNISTQSP